MSRKIEEENWDFSFCARDEDRNDVMRFNLSFESPDSDEEVVRQLNTFLQATGRRIAATLL